MIKKTFLLILFFSYILAQEQTYIPSPIISIFPSEGRDLNLNNKKQKKNFVENSYIINDDQLFKDKYLTADILDKAIENNSWSVVEHLLSIYSTFEEKDLILFLYAKGRLEHFYKNYKEAIKNYIDILYINKELSPIRFYLVQAFLENKEFDKASKEIKELEKYNDLPMEIKDLVLIYKKIIDDETSFKFNFQVNYLLDKNINETSNDEYIKLGNTEFKRDEKSLPQRGKGIAYNFGVEKDFKISEQNYLITNIQNGGKYYFNKNDYNDHIIKNSIGYRFQDGIKTINILPFYQKRIFANNQYNDTYGILLSNYFILNNYLKIIPSIEYGRNYHKEMVFLDGYYFFESLGFNYILNDKTILFNEFSLYENRAKDTSESFLKKNLKIGFYRDLPFNISTKISFSVGNKLYDNDKNLFNTKRRDDEYLTNISMWNSNLSLFQMIPKFNIEKYETTSNINIYNFDKTNYFISLEKNF